MKKPLSKKTRIIVTVSGLVVLALLLVALLGNSSIRKAQLTEALAGQTLWTYEDGFKVYLDFSEDKIVYSGDFGDQGHKEVATLSYRILDGETIEIESDAVKGEDPAQIKVEVKKYTIIFYPSFVKESAASHWIR